VRLSVVGGIVGVVLPAFVFGQSGTRKPDNSYNIAVIERAIASAKPGETWAKFGDVGVRISDLKIFRDRLAAAPSPSPAKGQITPPLATTPQGTAFKWPGGNDRFLRFHDHVHRSILNQVARPTSVLKSHAAINHNASLA
jgi:hypothetical protein